MATGRMKVLIVEDETLVGMGIQDALTKMGHEVVGQAASQAEALEQFKKLGPDLVLIDIQLDGGDGGVRVPDQAGGAATARGAARGGGAAVSRGGTVAAGEGAARAEPGDSQAGGAGEGDFHAPAAPGRAGGA